MNTFINLTLAEILATQDLGQKGIDKICDAVLNNSYDYEADPVSGVIINAVINNHREWEDMSTDLEYAINQLRRAQTKIKSLIQ